MAFCSFFYLFLTENTSEQLFTSKKIGFGKKNFSRFLAPQPPPGVPHFSALGAHIQNRLGRSSNLAYWGVHAKFQPIRTIQLARAMGRVRFLTSHLVIWGHLYWLSTKLVHKFLLFSNIKRTDRTSDLFGAVRLKHFPVLSSLLLGTKAPSSIARDGIILARMENKQEYSSMESKNDFCK